MSSATLLTLDVQLQVRESSHFNTRQERRAQNRKRKTAYEGEMKECK